MIPLLKNVSLFSGLTDDQLEHISQYCTRASVRAGTVLFSEKEIGTEFFMLMSGSIKIYTTGANNEEKILSVFRAGDSFGELALIDGKPLPLPPKHWRIPPFLHCPSQTSWAYSPRSSTLRSASCKSCAKDSVIRINTSTI